MKGKLVYPSDTGPCQWIVALDKDLIPMVSGALAFWENRWAWATEYDYEQGYQALQRIRINLMGKCITDLLNQNDRLYALLAESLRGTAYTSATVDPSGRLVYAPPLTDLPPAIAPASAGLQPALARKLDRLAELLGNAPDGVTPPADSLLVALRGNLVATAERNVIDSLGSFSPEQREELLGILGQILLAVL